MDSLLKRLPASSSAGTTMMLIGTLTAVVAALGLQIVGGRILGADTFAPVSVMWTLLFIGVTVFLLPVEQTVIRRLVLHRGQPRPLEGAIGVLATVIGGAALAAALFAFFAADALLDGDRAYVVVAAVLILGHGVLMLARGHLAAARRYAEYGLVVAMDGMSKLGGALLVLAAGGGPLALTWALAVSPIVIVLVRPFRVEAVDRPAVMEAPSERGFMTGFVVSTAASQTILAAGPWVVGLLGAPAASVSVFFVTTTLFRGPLSASYNLLARILPGITELAGGGAASVLRRWSHRMLGAGLGGSALAAGVSWVLGPSVVQLLFGPEYRPEPWLTALAAAAVVAGMFALGLGQILVGRGETGRMAAAWVTAVGAAAVAIAATTGDPLWRVAVGFFTGELVALVSLYIAATLAGRDKLAETPA